MTQEQIAAFSNLHLLKTTSEVTILISSLNDFFQMEHSVVLNII